MAMGEWLSVSSARELAARQIATEAAELEQAPEEEKQELELIYRAKGLDEAAARALTERMFASRGAALDALVREELGLDPQSLGGSAWEAAGASFLLFAVGAIFPVLPFFFATGAGAVAASLVVSGVALAAIGAATSLFTGRDLGSSALRQLAIGYAAAAVTYGAGRLVGASLG
jgi:VIT1/CCC1 family predicted Fe2+/Mn2+ transporter